MTEEEFETLRSWGESLTEDTRAEVRAAGRAIMLLAAEIERLQVQLWHAKLGIEPHTADGARPPRDDAAEPEPPAAGELEASLPQLEPALGGRLRAALGRAGRSTRRLQPPRHRRDGA